jgi:hypothetical protein
MKDINKEGLTLGFDSLKAMVKTYAIMLLFNEMNIQLQLDNATKNIHLQLDNMTMSL